MLTVRRVNALPRLINTTTLGREFMGISIYYLCYTNEGTEHVVVKYLAQGHTLKWLRAQAL